MPEVRAARPRAARRGREKLLRPGRARPDGAGRRRRAAGAAHSGQCAGVHGQGDNMSNAWKSLERAVAQKLGGKRKLRGSDFSQKDTDVELPDLPHWRIDAK